MLLSAEASPSEVLTSGMEAPSCTAWTCTPDGDTHLPRTSAAGRAGSAEWAFTRLGTRGRKRLRAQARGDHKQKYEDSEIIGAVLFHVFCDEPSPHEQGAICNDHQAASYSI